MTHTLKRITVMAINPYAFSNALNDKMEAFPENFSLGIVDGRGIMLRRPTFDCNWYWGFGYLGNRDCHYHLNGLAVMDRQNRAMQNKNLFYQLKVYFGESLTISGDCDLWTFCEIVQTVYTLRNMASLYYLGGSHYTTNPNVKLLKNEAEWQRINEVLIPAQIASMYAILDKYQ